MMMLTYVLRDIPNEIVLNFPSDKLLLLEKALQNPQQAFIYLELDDRRLLVNKNDVIKVEWTV